MTDRKLTHGDDMTAREQDFAILDEMREAFQDVPAEEIERQVQQALMAARAEMSQPRATKRPLKG
jgi:hypothetical protein